MANQLYRTLREACEDAPNEPVANYYEFNPLGSVVAKNSQIRDNVKYAIAYGLRVELHASKETLSACGLEHVLKLEGANIIRGNDDQPGYVRLKVCRAISPPVRGA
jgi:hypothetical protein